MSQVSHDDVEALEDPGQSGPSLFGLQLGQQPPLVDHDRRPAAAAVGTAGLQLECPADAEVDDHRAPVGRWRDRRPRTLPDAQGW